ncbi:RNA polymerase sigma factor [Pirellulaceae bacterium SH467]|jgi:RNA polymerase sigma-70 factor (ECF subfamily)
MPSSSGTRSSLIAGARARSEEAWSQIVSIYSPLIVAWGRRLGATPEQCDDLCQEVFSAASKGFASFQSDGKSGSFRGWLWRITYRKWIDSYRKTLDAPGPVGGSTAALRLEQLPAPDDESQEWSHPEWIQGLVDRAMRLVQSEFQERHWRAFWMSAVEGKPADQIAAALDMSPSNVRQIRSRILRRLRSVMGDAP